MLMAASGCSSQVLSIDDKSQIEALNRMQKMLPMQPGQADKRTYDYVRHGTTTLFAHSGAVLANT
jgi:hypothetical protein